MTLSFIIKATATLAYWITGLHLFFTDWGQPRFIFGGLFNVPEAIGLLFMAFAMFMFLFFSRKKGA